MATSGVIKTNTAFGDVSLSWNVVAQSIENNYSSVDYTLSITRSSNISSTAAKNYSIKINGISVASGTNTIGGSGTKVLKTGNIVINHNNDGSKSFSLSFSQEIAITWNGSYIDTITGSGTGTLDTIPRATTPTLHASSLDLGGTLTIYTYRASTNFKHVLEYKIGSTSGTIASGVDTAYYWAVPLDIANAIPNATSGVVTINCHTYNGSTYLGTKSVTFTANIPASVVPTCNFSFNAVSSALSNYYIQNKTKLDVSVSGSGIYGSTIKAYKTTIEGVNYASSTFTSNTLTTSGTISITSSVTDSRGRTGTKTQNISVLPYEAPKIISFSCNRATSSGAYSEEGTYLSAKINYSISSLNSKNSTSYVLYYKLKSATTWSSVSSGNSATLNTTILSSSGILNVNNTYDIRLQVTDSFGSVYADWEMGTSFTILDFNKSGKGLGIGKASEKDALEIAMPTTFSQKPSIQNGLKLLWSGTNTMGASVEANLNDNVSNQNYGIVLVFCRNGDYHYHSFFVPKNLVAATSSNGGGHNFFLTSEFVYMSYKYLYIYDHKIVGHANNTTDKGTDSKTGFIYNNSVFVLRYVYGV